MNEHLPQHPVSQSSVAPASPTIRLASIFQQGAVLQCDSPLTVWGWAPPSRRVRVALGKQVAEGWVSEYGDFRVILPPLPAGGPHVLRVDLPGAPALAPLAPLEVTDILLGEVWLASGQSNMEMTLDSCGEAGLQAAALADDPHLRFFKVEKRAELAPQRDVHGEWKQATPDNARQFSAVAYHFARTLRKKLQVPVGVVVSSWGGTPIEAWMSRQAHARNRHLHVTTGDYALYAHSESRWARVSENPADLPSANYPKDPGLREESAAWAACDFDDSAWPTMRLPASWQERGHPSPGIFWFRKTVQLPQKWRGCDLVVELGAVDKQDISFANGQEIGRTGSGLEDKFWNQLRRYTIPAELTTGAEITLAVRAYSFVYDGGMIGPASSMRLLGPGGPNDETVALDGEWRYAVECDFGHVPGDHDPGHLTPQSPHILFDNMIAPLAPYALRGGLWYQGERNTAHPERYADLLRDLIEDWRRLWAQGDFPFLIVQLPAHLLPSEHQPEATWARLRQSQLHVGQTVPGAVPIMTLDVGDAEDIHPRDKEPVGRRLAQAALVRVYGFSGAATGPLPLDARRVGGEVQVRFDLDSSTLTTRDGALPATVFLGDGKGGWFAAEACLRDGLLLASAEACPHPVEIAYAWANNPPGANIVNSDGHPASPFWLKIDPES